MPEQATLPVSFSTVAGGLPQEARKEQNNDSKAKRCDRPNRLLHYSMCIDFFDKEKGFESDLCLIYLGNGISWYQGEQYSVNGIGSAPERFLLTVKKDD